MSNKLIAFYSRADENYVNGILKQLDIGNTEVAAGIIAEKTGADVFKIQQLQPYSKDYNECIAQAQNDQKQDTRPRLKDYPETIDKYDVIYLGYPIWWGIAAWPVDNFIKENDFTGKTVIPFCTSSSSDIGESGDLLAQMAGTGEWKAGMRFSESPSEDEITDWLDSLDY